MGVSAIHFAGAALGLMVVCATAYYLGVCCSAWRFRRDRKRDSLRDAQSTAPPVLLERKALSALKPWSALKPLSVLKPLGGSAPGLDENLRTHALQDYPKFELLFGVTNASDPAAEAVRRLAAEFPHLSIELVECGHSPEGNPKVFVLEKLAEKARYDLLLVNDSDIRVGSGYFRKIVADLSENGVGLVSCLYRAQPGGTFASLIEALWISTEYQGQVLLGRSLQGMKFALGATMLLRRSDLARIGGFTRIRPFLADDYLLGNLISSSGQEVALSGTAVETLLPADSWKAVWRHLLRWSRTIRVMRPGGHAGLIVTHGTVWSLAALAAGSHTPPLAAAAACCLTLRFVAAWLVADCVDSREAKRSLWLLPLADLLAFLVWLSSFFGSCVDWRGKQFSLDRRGRMARTHGAVRAR